MEHDRLQRAALQWGGVALVVQLWVALVFVRRALEAWVATRPELVTFADSVDRFSQLKAPALKYPWSGVYCVLAVAGIVALIGWLVIQGLREAMAPEPESSETDEAR